MVDVKTHSGLCLYDMQAIRTKSDDPTTLFAMKLCLMQVCNQCSPPAQANLVGYGFSCPAQKTPSLKPKEPIPDSPSTDAEVWNVERWPSVQGVDRKLETLIEMVKDGHRRSGEGDNLCSEHVRAYSCACILRQD